MKDICFSQNLLVVNDYKTGDYEFYYWRTSTGIEVDFIAYGPHGICAFEIKRGARHKPSDLKGLQEFKKSYPMAKLFLINGSKRSTKEGDVSILPFEIALKTIPHLLGIY